MSLLNICIEIRKQLHCANVFLQLDDLTETEYLKINVSGNELRLQELSTETRVDLTDYFTVEARTISNLVVEECNASFRLTIDNLRDEPFKDKTAGAKKFAMSQPALREDDASAIYCNNCKCCLTSEQHKYSRIREFPSNSIDVSEFFCHNAPDFGDVLVPRPTDFFYGFHFVILNRSLTEGTVNEKDSHVYCRRCLQYLGQTMFAGKALKIWADTVLLKINDSEDYCRVFAGDSSSTDTWSLLQKILQETTVSHGDQEDRLLQMEMGKIIIKATFPNREAQYLLLQVLERHLEILRNSAPLCSGGHNNNNVMHVQLEAAHAMKVIFRLVDKVGADDRTDAIPPLLAYWQQDFAIQTTTVSPSLFSHLMDTLHDNNQLMPEKYRYTHDNFQISYVFQAT